MTPEQIAQLFGFFALAFVVSAYFLTKKSAYLLFQLLNMLCLALSYLFCANFFAMAGITVSATRTFTFFMYERRGKEAPLYLAFIFAGLSALTWVIINVVILKTAEWIDIVLVSTLVSYTFIFKIRKLSHVRYALIIPLSLSVFYNIVCWSTIFSVFSYGFELFADIVSIGKEHIRSFNNRRKAKC